MRHEPVLFRSSAQTDFQTWRAGGNVFPFTAAEREKTSCCESVCYFLHLCKRKNTFRPVLFVLYCGLRLPRGLSKAGLV